jgi:nucleoside-diphosphate-sugar epimerase
MRLATADVQVVNVGSDQAASIADIAAEIGSAVGREPNVVSTSEARNGDLVADITRLCHVYEADFADWRHGLREMANG